jgi:hypothetical protein
MQLVITLYCKYWDVIVTRSGLEDFEVGLGWLVGYASSPHGANNFCVCFQIVGFVESE